MFALMHRPNADRLRSWKKRWAPVGCDWLSFLSTAPIDELTTLYSAAAISGSTSTLPAQIISLLLRQNSPRCSPAELCGRAGLLFRSPVYCARSPPLVRATRCR